MNRWASRHEVLQVAAATMCGGVSYRYCFGDFGASETRRAHNTLAAEQDEGTLVPKRATGVALHTERCQNRGMMIPAIFVFGVAVGQTALVAEVPTDYATAVHKAFVAASANWINENANALKGSLKGQKRRLVVLELMIGADGALSAERLVMDSEDNTVDDLARGLVLAVEPLPPPPPEVFSGQANAVCLMRFRFSIVKQKPALAMATACQNGVEPVFQVAGIDENVSAEKDPGARLFLGWAKEGLGDLESATRLYRQAVISAPDWDLAARALGLSLVKGKKAPQAIPYLNTYVEAHKGAVDAHVFAREIDRFKKLQEAKIAEANRVRTRLSKADIGMGIKKGYALLEPCLTKARKERRLEVGVDTLVLTWRIKHDGTAHMAHLEAPKSLVATEYAECIERSVGTWRFPRYSEGSEVTASRVPIKVRGSTPEVKVASETTTPQPTESIDESSFSQCERTPEEIQGHIRKSWGRVNACIMAERQRAPNVPMPEDLPISFVIDAQGPIRNIAVEHRAYREGPLFVCVQKALYGALLPNDGADCPAQFALDLHKLAPRHQF